MSAESGPPAYLDSIAEVHGLNRIRSWLKITDIEVGETVVDEAVHGSIRTVGILVDQPRDEVGGEGDHESLGTGNGWFFRTELHDWVDWVDWCSVDLH